MRLVRVPAEWESAVVMSIFSSNIVLFVLDRTYIANYPALDATLVIDAYPTDSWGPNEHERDARVVAEYLRDADRANQLDAIMNPQLSTSEKATASLEGWILGVT